MTAQQVVVRLALGPYVAHRNESRGVGDHQKQPRWRQENEEEDNKTTAGSCNSRTSQSWYHRPEHATLEYVRHAAGTGQGGMETEVVRPTWPPAVNG
jgi:hypothetical protein